MLNLVKAQLERRATKPAKLKVSSLERKLFLAKQCSVISGKKEKLQQVKNVNFTIEGMSEEDKQLLIGQLTNAQVMNYCNLCVLD